MVEETLRVLEYDKITHLLGQLTVSEPGRKLALALKPLQSRMEVADSLAEISEMRVLFEEQGTPPVGGYHNLTRQLRTLRAEGSWLSTAELLKVSASIETAHACRRYFYGQEKTPRLSQRAENIARLAELKRDIRQRISDREELLDSASFKLGELRHEIRQSKNQIKRILEGLLSSENLAGAFQDKIITERNGRYVVPVKADHRGQVKGFIHDESASGQTLFVEPAAVLERNNELKSLLREEQREEERILRQLSEKVRKHTDELLANQSILARLDFIAAAGRFSRLTDGVAPHLAKTPAIELKDARHPLLLFHPDGTPRDEETVPVDLLLGKDCHTLVISGPNTGGKTVALKTVGLLMLMLASGLHIPCHKSSRAYLFGKIFADIGDEQSIEENLSTFSGHLLRSRHIIEKAGADSLVLLDEAGTGTDPSEGGALAMAILDILRAKKARTVLTTHLNLIKSYAHLERGVENAAVEFDSKTLAPTYRLHYGIPGASSAFTIARRLGMPEEVLERAGKYLGEGERKGLELIEELNRQRLQLGKELAEARLLRDRAKEERNRRKQLLEELERQKGEIKAKARRRADQLIQETERRLKALLKETQEAKPGAREVARRAGEIKEIRENVSALRVLPKREGSTPRNVKKGEILRITTLGTEGEVIRVLGEEVELSIHGKKLRLSLKDLEQFSPRRFAKKHAAMGNIKSSVSREGFEPKLLIVGKRVNEALPLVERFLDDALLHHIREVEIVHGSGEGILRRAVREFLATSRAVTAFHAADVSQGGDNVTIAKLGE